MGYTHRWTNRHLEPAAWDAFCNDAEGLLAFAKEQGYKLANWAGDEGTDPEIFYSSNPYWILRFNGLATDDFETFELRGDHDDWTFCKTGQRPYDAVVVAVLALAHDAYGLVWHSDGDEEDHAEGLALLQAYRDTLPQDGDTRRQDGDTLRQYTVVLRYPDDHNSHPIECVNAKSAEHAFEIAVCHVNENNGWESAEDVETTDTMYCVAVFEGDVRCLGADGLYWDGVEINNETETHA